MTFFPSPSRPTQSANNEIIFIHIVMQKSSHSSTILKSSEQLRGRMNVARGLSRESLLKIVIIDFKSTRREGRTKRGRSDK